MGSRMKQVRLGACTVGALAVATLVLSTTPAAASGTYSGRAYVYGASTYTDDWNDEGIVSTGSNTTSNATCLWQKILWADGKLASSGIDGIFGSGTAAATKNWQSDWGLTADGSAGQNTWTEAGNWLDDLDSDGVVDSYVGTSHVISVSRDSDGRYAFYDAGGSKRLAGYDYETCTS
ncbi:peptidoglycan-binding protein [Streptomyces sp. NBC_00203]|uniref:peptidoglycan-binding domain-containing protein n=1 Tax=Streptomyces sp. NBC_00203 TaxID=2975680 RepID=UPI003243B5C2